MSKLSTEDKKLISENLNYLKRYVEYDYIAGVDLSLTNTGWALAENANLQLKNPEICSFDNSKRTGAGDKIRFLYNELGKQVDSFKDKQVVMGYERVSAATHFTGLVAVVMAQSALLHIIAEKECEKDVFWVGISSTALKKYFTGKGRYIAKEKTAMKKQYGLKSSQDPVKYLVVQEINKFGFNFSYEENDKADAVSAMLFCREILDLASQYDGNNIDAFIVNINTSYQKAQAEALISYLKSWELLKENLSSYEYTKTRKKVKSN